MKLSLPLTVLILAVAVVLPTQLFQLSKANTENASGQEPPKQATPKRTPSMISLGEPHRATPRKRSIQLGDEGTVDLPKNYVDESIPVTDEYYWFGDYLKGTVAKDKEGLNALEAKGHLFYVKRTTRVRVIDSNNVYFEYAYVPIAKVRFLSGQLSGKVGWVLEEFVVTDSQ